MSDELAPIERAWRESISNPHTARQYWQTLHKFEAFCAQHGVAVLHATRDDIENWMSHLLSDHSSKTANNYLSGLKNFYRFAKSTGAIAIDPARHMRSRSEGPKFIAHCRDQQSLAVMRKLIRCAERDPEIMQQVVEYVALLDDPRRKHRSYDRRGVDRKLMASAMMSLAHVTTCSYCGESGTERRGPDGDVWTVDHVVAISEGGADELENLVKACKSCNSAKWANAWQPRPGTISADGNLWRAKQKTPNATLAR